jgi:hypothetical protein
VANYKQTSCAEQAQPQFLALCSAQGKNVKDVERWKKSRLKYAIWTEKHMFVESDDQEDEEDVIYFSTELSFLLYMSVLGDNEQGQTTVFKRSLSVWNLQLAPNAFGGGTKVTLSFVASDFPPFWTYKNTGTINFKKIKLVLSINAVFTHNNLK